MMLGTKTIGRSLVFGLGYVVGTRAGRERYDQMQKTVSSLAANVRKQIPEAPDSNPSSIVGGARRAWDDSDIKLGP